VDRGPRRERSGAHRRLVAVAAAVLAGLCATTPAAAAGEADAAPASPERARLVAALRSKVPIDLVDVVGDPYETWRDRAPPRPPPGTVCGVRFEPDGTRYRLGTFPGEAAARAAGFAVTHVGACGTCSTLQDLAVYLERPDLTAPVRRCGIHPTAAGGLACLERLGFSRACARTWWFNAKHTEHACFAVCVLAWIEHRPPTTPEGRLDPCLQCDEDRSGPVFKATAGRTRRDSGIRSSIPRPDEEVAHVVHDYVPGAGAAPGQ
jgi:hypothetical protein